MPTADIERLYNRKIKPLPIPARLELLARIAQDLIREHGNGVAPERSLLDLEGLGAELWARVDAQSYVDDLRAEWEGRR